MMMLLVFIRILILGSFDGGVEGSDESEEGGIVMVLISLLVKGLMRVIDAFSKNSVLSVKGLTTTVDFFRVQCVCPSEDAIMMRFSSIS